MGTLSGGLKNLAVNLFLIKDVSAYFVKLNLFPFSKTRTLMKRNFKEPVIRTCTLNSKYQTRKTNFIIYWIHNFLKIILDIVKSAFKIMIFKYEDGRRL